MFGFFEKKDDGSLVEVTLDYVDKKKALTEFALETGANKIATTISKLGFIVVSKDETEKRDVEYKLNVSPNANQNATDFWNQAINRMITKSEGCLIVNTRRNGWFIADSWTESNDVMNAKTYSNVNVFVDDNSTTVSLNKKFKSDDVLHLKLTNKRLLILLDQLNTITNKAYNVAANGFIAKSPKLKVQVPASVKMVKDGKPVKSNEYADMLAERFSSEEIKALLVQEGITLETIDGKSSLSSDDIAKLKTNAFENVAYALNIPVDMMLGKANKEQENAFFTYAVDPVISIIEDAINFAWVGEESYKQGVHVMVNKMNIRHIDILDCANNIDKLISNGFTYNFVMDLFDLPETDEEWANTPRFTKNYSTDISGSPSNSSNGSEEGGE